MNTTSMKRKPNIKVTLIISISALIVILWVYSCFASFGFAWPYKVNRNIPIEDSIEHFEEFSGKIDEYIENSSHVVEKKNIEKESAKYTMHYTFSEDAELYVYLDKQMGDSETFCIWYHVGNNNATDIQSNIDVNFCRGLVNLLSGREFSDKELEELISRRDNSSKDLPIGFTVFNEKAYGLYIYSSSYTREENKVKPYYGNCDYIEKLSISGYTTYGIN